MKASDLIEDSEKAIIIFTDGKGLSIENNGNGISGVWVIDENSVVDKVIIYKRDKIKNVNEIYLGNFVQFLPSNQINYENRLIVEFDSMKFIGETNSKWYEFTETKPGASNPIKYLR